MAGFATLPTAIVVLLAAALILVMAMIHRRRMRRAEEAAAEATAQAASAEATLISSPMGSFAFSYLGGGPRCSLSLVQMLGLREADATEFEAVAAAFVPEDGERLKEAAERLRAEGMLFALDLRHRDGQRCFRVEGNRAYSTGSDLLWVRETTDVADRIARLESERDEYAGLLDALPMPVWVRGDLLQVTYCNDAYARAVGRERDEVLAEGIELAGAALTEASHALARRALERGQPEAQRHHVVVSGERRLLELLEKPLGDGLLLGSAKDLTRVGELQAELSRHIAAHAEVLESLGSGIAIFGADMRLKFFNNAYARMFSLDEAFLSGEPHLGDVLESLRERRRLPEQQDFPAYKQEKIRAYSTLIEPIEELMHIPDGSTLRLQIAPHPFGGVLFSLEDVTDRLALERSYNTLIEVQRETLDNLYEGVAVYGADGRLKLFNPAFARIWSLDPDFLSGEPHVRAVASRIRDYFDVSDEDWPEVMEQICVVSTEPEQISGRHERAEGSVLDMSQVPLPDGAGLFTYLDVTDSIRVERALRERNEALETTDRLKSEFIANVSYELRTPLNAIVGFAEILENQFFGELNDRQLEYSRAIVESSQRLLTLINDILDLATIEAGYLRLDLGPVAMPALLDSIRTLGHERARNRGIDFSVTCPADMGEILADERRVKQALFNLVSNAFKFTPEGGRVAVTAQRQDDEIQFVVEDSGIGIPQEDHARVFGKFERGSGQGRQSGAGLGLSLVKSLVELHGGWVELASAPEQGTRVICRLPVEPSAEIQARAARPDGTARLGGLTGDAAASRST